MKHLTDDELVNELKLRFEENKKTVRELNKVMDKLQRVNKKLTESEALKSHFLSNIRNEINNPLTAILGLAETIFSGDDLAVETIHSMAKTIYQEAFNLDFQLRTIFAAAEIEAGEAHLHISNVDIEQIIHRIIDLFRLCPKAKDLQIDFINKVESDSVHGYRFMTDPEKFHLIVSNLLSNAIEYGYEGDQIVIKTWKDGKNLKISVRDFGIGIEHTDRKRIFDRFVQLDTGLTKEYKGHGLGLSVTKDAVELLGGIISVSSNKKKEGSFFTVSIPEAEPAAKNEFFAFDGNEELF